MTGRRLLGFVVILAGLAGCTEDTTEEVDMERLGHACELLENIDTEPVVGFPTDTVQRTQSFNEQYNVNISQCDHYAEDMQKRFSVTIRQELSNRKVPSGRSQLEELHDRLSEFSEAPIDWRYFDNLGEAAAWNGTANQLTVYKDKGHTTLTFAVYGTEKDQEHALELARVFLP